MRTENFSVGPHSTFRLATSVQSSDAVRPVGCTQSTEILSTAGVVLSGSLPPGCELATMYTAAVTTRASNARHAQDLIALLIGADQRELRQRAGFLDVRK